MHPKRKALTKKLTKLTGLDIEVLNPAIEWICNMYVRKISLTSYHNEDEIRIIGRDNEELVVKGYEAGIVKVLRTLPVKARVKLMKLTEDECLTYFKERRQSYRDYALEILSKKWYSRETGERFTLKDYECDFIEGYPTYQRVKNKIKKDKVPEEVLVKIIEHFTNDYSEYYQKQQ